MAEVLRVMPRHGNAGKRRTSKYERYLDGQIWKISPEDMNGTALHTVRFGLMKLAQTRRLRVKTVTTADGCLVVQATPKGEST